MKLACVALFGSAGLSVGLASACGNGQVTYGVPPDGGVTTSPDAGQAVGQACGTNLLCRLGLTCTNGVCAPGHTTANGQPCVISDECVMGSYCGPGRTCTPAGQGQTGASCKSDADCASGLRCDLVGLSAQCQPEGMHDAGGTCTTSADCYGGLVCLAGACATPPPTGGLSPLGFPTWKGETCSDPDAGPTQAYFRVPRGMGDGDFYRLPFPNDVRLKNGHPDLTGHPTPGPELLGYDIVARYLQFVGSSTDGFSTYPTVIFRFSAGVSFDSLKTANEVRWVDITPGGAGNDLGLGWEATTSRNAYVCPNWMGVRPPGGAPLATGHTYAVLLMNAARDAMGQPVQVSSDLSALLGPAAPSDPALSAVYPAYKPLRDWAAAMGVAVGNILNAAVFTTGHPTATPSKLPAAVAAAAAPVASGWVLFGPNSTSPCPQASGTRACGTPDPGFSELHALVTLPIFQQGTEPYLTPSDGGDLATMSDGTPIGQHTEQVCMSLTIPKGATMPAGGWPVVVYAHGTGGSFRSAVTDGVAGSLASVDDGMGGQVHVAVLGIDQVEHGTRRGSSQADPGTLFYNFANPGAARGNVLQGAADQLALLRFVTGFDLPAAQSPTGSEIKLGPSAFWGHSQGATEGGVALAYASGYSGAVLSGEGASLIDALLGKKSPIDIADIVPIVLEDSSVDAFHPVLSILQNAMDSADPLNHAAALSVAPAMGTPPKNVFQPYGIGDTYAPPATEQTFAIAAGLALAAPPASVAMPDTFGGLTPMVVPVGGNVTVGMTTVTAVVREYMPSGYDGHFVAFKDANAQADVAHFLADALGGKAPKVGR